MKHMNLIKNTLLAFAAAFVIFFAPIDDKKASAAETSVSELNETATKYLGVRYSYGGTTEKGFDCSGYVRYVFNELGESLPRTSGEMYQQGEEVEKSDLQAGDLVFFKTSGKGVVSHVGIYIGSGQFIHASSSKGVTKTSITDKYYWGSKYVGAKRVAQFAANE